MPKQEFTEGMLLCILLILLYFRMWSHVADVVSYCISGLAEVSGTLWIPDENIRICHFQREPFHSLPKIACLTNSAVCCIMYILWSTCGLHFIYRYSRWDSCLHFLHEPHGTHSDLGTGIFLSIASPKRLQRNGLIVRSFRSDSLPFPPKDGNFHSPICFTWMLEVDKINNVWKWEQILLKGSHPLIQIRTLKQLKQ